MTSRPEVFFTLDITSPFLLSPPFFVHLNTPIHTSQTHLLSTSPQLFLCLTSHHGRPLSSRLHTHHPYGPVPSPGRGLTLDWWIPILAADPLPCQGAVQFVRPTGLGTTSLPICAGLDDLVPVDWVCFPSGGAEDRTKHIAGDPRLGSDRTVGLWREPGAELYVVALDVLEAKVRHCVGHCQWIDCKCPFIFMS